MRKNHLFYRGRTLALLAVAAGFIGFSSCAQDGFDKEKWDNGVYNTQLENPAADDILITPNADGTMQTIKWPVVYGGGGYKVLLKNLTTEKTVLDTIMDVTTITVSRAEDSNYQLEFAVLDNKEHNNTGSSTLIKTFTTFATADGSIPAGDLNQWFASNPLPEGKNEVVYDLAEGGSYTLSGKLDFGAQSVTLRSVGENANLTTSDGACFVIGNGIKLQNLNIDCTGNKANALLLMTDKPSEALSTEALGYKAKGANQDGYVMTNAVLIKNVNIKNLNKSLIYGNKKPWSLTSLIINNCMIQLDNGDNGSSLINMYGGGNGLIKSLTIKNSTLFNLQKNTNAYVVRYSNGSAAQPQKIFGTGATATLSLTNNTFANVYTGKDFANNMANTPSITTTLTDNIFYDVFRIYQFVQTQTVRKTVNNYIWWVQSSKQTNDITRTDSDGNPLCTEADPGFPTMDALKALDFTQQNCGANFTPSGTPLDNKAGDPRWLPTAE